MPAKSPPWAGEHAHVLNIHGKTATTGQFCVSLYENRLSNRNTSNFEGNPSIGAVRRRLIPLALPCLPLFHDNNDHNSNKHTKGGGCGWKIELPGAAAAYTVLVM